MNLYNKVGFAENRVKQIFRIGYAGLTGLCFLLFFIRLQFRISISFVWTDFYLCLLKITVHSLIFPAYLRKILIVLLLFLAGYFGYRSVYSCTRLRIRSFTCCLLLQFIWVSSSIYSPLVLILINNIQSVSMLERMVKYLIIS